MKEQTVAALPGEWLKKHPISSSWMQYCLLSTGQWVKVMYWQNALISLLEDNNIPSVILKGSAAAMYYPYPSLRTMGDVDILVKRSDLDRAIQLMEVNGYKLTHSKEEAIHHYHFSKNNISFELHKRLPIVSETDEELLSMFEEGIDCREWREIEDFKFPVLPTELNGLVLIFHINQHLRTGLGLRQIVDWMMYVHSLMKSEWNNLIPKLEKVNMKRLAETVTAMCQKYLGLDTIVDMDESLPVDALMSYIMEKGNFGRKAGIDGRISTFSFFSTERGGLFKRLQEGGLSHWKAAKKHAILRPFAWIYQGFRIIGILNKNKISPKEISEQHHKGIEQKELLDALGLKMDRMIEE